MLNPFQYIIEKDNMTYEELGKVFGISRQGIHQLVKGKTTPNGKTMLLLIMLYKSYFTPLELYNYYYLNNLSSIVDN